MCNVDLKTLTEITKIVYKYTTVYMCVYIHIFTYIHTHIYNFQKLLQ